MDNFETVWVERLQSDQTRQEAAAAIYERFSNQLLAIIQKNLSERLASRVDPEDILQNAFTSFFKRPFEVPDARALFNLLVEISLNKTRSAARFHQRECRDVRVDGVSDDIDLAQKTGLVATQPKDRATSVPVGNSDETEPDSFFDDDTLSLMAAGATAEQAGVVLEIFESFDSEFQQILNRRLEGWTESEIAGELDVTRRTVTRRLALIRRQLAESSPGRRNSD